MAIAAIGFTVADTVIAATSVAAAGASAYMSARASSEQASAAASAADYNAKVDVANAQQQALDANSNITKQRQQDQEYQSDQRAAYAASGVLESGSPMEVEATTAGRQEQNIQQYWTSVQEKESAQYAAAEEGVVEGQEEADIYHLQGAGDIFSGIGNMENAAMKEYASAND